MSQIKPVNGYILVKTLAFKEESKSGIILKNTVKKGDLYRGEIIGRSDGSDEAIYSVRIGEVVYFDVYNGKKCPSNDTESDFILLKEEDICGVEGQLQ